MRFFEKQHLRSMVPYFFLVALVIFFTIVNPVFFSERNLYNLLRQMSILLVVSTAATYVILMGSIDLSVGAILTMSGIIMARYIESFGLWSIFIGVAIGLISGLLNALIFVYFGIPSFLATLGTNSMFLGIAYLICGGTPVTYNRPDFRWISTGNILGGFPVLAIWAGIIYALACFISIKTRFGRYVFAIGGGEKVAELSGVLVNRYKAATMCLSGLLCGIAGVLMTARIGAATPEMGLDSLLESIAATVMAGTALSGGVGGPIRTFMGVIIIAMLSSGLTIMGVHVFTQLLVKGMVVILAVAMNMEKSRLELIK